MARVLQIPEVVDHLMAIGEFVAEESQSLEIALGLLDKIDQKCKLYASHPAMGTDPSGPQRRRSGLPGR